jgi:hypothetical protein
VRKPDFFIVGAPKCGTTALFDYLGQHPEIFVSEAKELHYFGTDLILPGMEIEEKIYRALFAPAQTEKRVGDASGWYLFSARAAIEIKEFHPAANIIIMLRNPVDMIYSLHSQRLYSGTEDIEDFQAAIEAEEDRRRGARSPKHSWIRRGLFYLEVAKYTAQVKRYVDVFGWGKIKVIIFDDFISNPQRTYQETLEFLEVDCGFEPVIRVVNPNKRARSRIAQDLLDRRPPPLVRQLGRTFMPAKTRRRLYQTLQGLNADLKPRAPIDQELRRRLEAGFSDDVKSLSILLGRDLTYWCRE